MRICIVQFNHLGDMVMATAFTRAAKASFPNSKITLLVRSSVAPLARMAPGVDEVATLDTPWFARNDSAGWLHTILFCLKKFQNYDYGFELYGDPRSIAVTRMISKYCAGFGIRGFGFMLNKNVNRGCIFGIPMHQVHLWLLKIEAARPDLETPLIQIDNKTHKDLSLKTSPLGIKEYSYAVIHPGVSAPIREWPDKNWIKLTEVLIDRLPVVCADFYGRQAGILNLKFSGRKFHLINLSLPEFAALVHFSKIVISVDSLAGHLAAACRTSAVVINSGTTIPDELGPGWSRHARVMYNDSCPLSPCGLDKCAYGYPSPCMQCIETEDVLSAAVEMLKTDVPEKHNA